MMRRFIISTMLAGTMALPGQMAMAETDLGEMVGKFTSWTPLEYRGVLLPEDVDRDDPWQFKNVRVT